MIFVGGDRFPAGVQIETCENLWVLLKKIPLKEIVRLTFIIYVAQ